MPPNSRSALMRRALLLTMISLTGCASLQGEPPVARQLPHESNVVLDPAPKPQIGPGTDARVAWKKEEARADANASRLVRSKKIYRGIRTSYGAAK